MKSVPHALKLVALVAAGIGLVGCGVDTTAETKSKNDPIPVTVGKAFTIGKHQTLAGWTVTKDALGSFAITGKVKNVSDKTSTAFFHVKFLNATDEVLGNVQCNSSDLEPGQTETLNCISDGKYAKFAKVTAEATF